MISPDEFFAVHGTIDDGPEPSGKANGHDKHDADFPVVQASAWAGCQVSVRQWAVQDRIPMYNVTLLSGEGAVGKSLLMQQLAVSTVLTRDWLGVVPEQGPVLYLSAEEDESEYHRRLIPIVNHYGAKLSDLDQLHVLCLAGKDAVLGAPNREGIIRPTDLFQNLKCVRAVVYYDDPRP